MPVSIEFRCVVYTVLLLGFGCQSDPSTPALSDLEDLDGDGWTVAEGDCWESSQQPHLVEGAQTHRLKSSDIYPGAEDFWYDGIDSNCDGIDDFDQDGDGFVPALYEGISTLGVEGSGTLIAGDCDDLNTEINPAVEELPIDQLDSNCDGFELCYMDEDGDGYGTTLVLFEDLDCDGAGVSAMGGDCEPSNSSIHPDQEERCDGVDTDCDGNLWSAEEDLDGDGFVTCVPDGVWWDAESYNAGGDCDDDNPIYFPGQVWYLDEDGDGYGSNESTIACSPFEAYTARQIGDCDPWDATIHPYAVEVADSIDSNCDGLESNGYTNCMGGPHQSAYFLMCLMPFSQAEAQDFCSQFGYEGLASVLDESENNFLLLLDRFHIHGVWLGASDSRAEDQFRWSDSSTWGYSNWSSGHPGLYGLQRNCVAMQMTGLWEEVDCGQAYTGLVCGQRF